jgi:hypothetical protein
MLKTPDALMTTSWRRLSWKISIANRTEYDAGYLKAYEQAVGENSQRAAAPNDVRPPGWIRKPSDKQTRQSWYIASGFPLRAGVDYLPRDGSLPDAAIDLLPLDIHGRWGGVIQKHGYILWPRFLLNIILVAFLLYPLLRAVRIVRAVRARSRWRRGLCESCGYPLAGLALCPECGAGTIPPPSTPHTEPAPCEPRSSPSPSPPCS